MKAYTNIDAFLQDQEERELNSPLTDKEHKYYEALFMSFRKFIEEERKGKIFTEARLMKGIEAARTLYKW